MNRRTWLLVGLGALLAIVVSAWVTSREQAYPGHLDPQNPTPGGGQAVARVLAHQGVDVEVVRSRAEFEAAQVDNRTLVVVTSPESLGRSTVAALQAHAGAQPVIIVEPGARVLELLDLSAQPLGTDLPDPVRAGCPDFDGLTIQTPVVTAYSSGAAACFRVEAGSLLAKPGAGLTLLGAGDILGNGQVLEADNAAVALRLLGARQHLVWYVPSTADLAAGDEVGLGALLPPWIRPGLWVLAFSVLALLLWRGRRLGRLAIEPLPVSVKAIETAQSRGRLYRKANDRGHAAGALREAARSRMVDRLKLPHDATPDAVVGAVAAATGRHDIQHLLYGDPPAGDRDLIQLATNLAELDDQLRKASR